MAETVIAIRLEDGSEIFAEVEQPQGAFGEASFADGEAQEIDFGKALRRVKSAANELIDTIRTMSVQPDECEITFGVKLNAQAGAIIAKASAEANFTVKLKWAGKAQE
ncbi:MAG TPA: CU044_2847 family protein [Allosphingosinicella sp.]|jgi:hypothetical protein